jgi:hypothetical protein
MSNGKSVMGLLKTLAVIGSGIVGASLIAFICWVLFMQVRVESCIGSRWNDPVNGLKIQAEKIADSTTRSYTDELYERQARIFCNQQATMTEEEKMRGEKIYQDYIRDLKTRNKMGK